MPEKVATLRAEEGNSCDCALTDLLERLNSRQNQELEDEMTTINDLTAVDAEGSQISR